MNHSLQNSSAASSDDVSEHDVRTALVLAGAGAAGNAWQLGLISGLSDSGVDITAVDLIIGTSAGSTVAAQITSGIHPSDLYAAIVAETPPPAARSTGRGQQGAPHISGPAYMEWSDGIIAASADASDMRQRFSAAALDLDASDGADGARWRSVVAARLPNHRWPQQRVFITAMDARTGEPVVFDRDSGVELVDAVAASTSPMTPYPIGENRYLNGAYRRGSNADLAAGYARVLVLDPFSGRSRHPLKWGMDLVTQVDELRAGGSTVETVFPDTGAGDVFNANALDPSTRRPAALGGYEQGQALAQQLVGFAS